MLGSIADSADGGGGAGSGKIATKRYIGIGCQRQILKTHFVKGIRSSDISTYFNNSKTLPTLIPGSLVGFLGTNQVNFGKFIDPAELFSNFGYMRSDFLNH